MYFWLLVAWSEERRNNFLKYKNRSFERFLYFINIKTLNIKYNYALNLIKMNEYII